MEMMSLVQHVEPLGVARTSLARSHEGMRIVFDQPFVEVEIVILLGPQHAGQRLPVHATLVFAQILAE